MPIDTIVAFTGVSRREVFRILALHGATGDVVKHRERQKLGRPRSLTINDVAVSLFS
jgi:hypothetical protein